MSIQSELIEKLANRTARIGVIGLGYVGLPLAVRFAQAGFHVTGIDLDPRKIAAIEARESYIEDVPSSAMAALDNLFASSDYAALADCDAVSICVPTPLNKTGDPDMSYIVSATDGIARYLHPGMVIVLESTTYPGTTREVLLPRFSASGLTVGEDFFLAFSPERVDPGRTDYTTKNTPKVIGGVTPACLEVSKAFYGQAIDHLVPVSSPEAAEMAKLFENTFRAVNIGLANEMLLMCNKLGLDAWEILDAAATKPFGFMKFTPGPGLGGHCIPIDPLYLSWKLRTMQYNARFIELASEINTEMPRYWVQQVQDALNEVAKAVNGARVLVLGIAYKRDVNDIRESPALDIIHLLEEKGAVVEYHDPHVPSYHHEGAARTGIVDLESGIKTADCVIIVTDHSAYDWNAIRTNASLIVDTRHVTVKKGEATSNGRIQNGNATIANSSALGIYAVEQTIVPS